jgi:hypothetical protein
MHEYFHNGIICAPFVLLISPRLLSPQRSPRAPKGLAIAMDPTDQRWFDPHPNFLFRFCSDSDWIDVSMPTDEANSHFIKRCSQVLGSTGSSTSNSCMA